MSYKSCHQTTQYDSSIFKKNHRFLIFKTCQNNTDDTYIQLFTDDLERRLFFL